MIITAVDQALKETFLTIDEHLNAEGCTALAVCDVVISLLCHSITQFIAAQVIAVVLGISIAAYQYIGSDVVVILIQIISGSCA